MKHLTMLAALALLVAVAPVYAVNPAMVYVVHGIPGTALGLPTTDLPVDVKVNGSCVVELKGLNFGEIRGPLPLDAGLYDVEIKPANTLNPCANATVLAAQVNLTAGLNASLVAHLTAAGAPVITPFINDVSALKGGQGRFILHHAAQAPAVDASLFRGQGNESAPSISVPGFANGGKAAAEVRPGTWRAALSVGGTRVFGPAALTLEDQTVQLVYAVGVFPTSFRFITKTIPALP